MAPDRDMWRTLVNVVIGISSQRASVVSYS
jgi:hypothetical protein